MVLIAYAIIFLIGSEDYDDAQFVGQEVCWQSHMFNKCHGYVCVVQNNFIDEFEEILVPISRNDESLCTREMHTVGRSVLGRG